MKMLLIIWIVVFTIAVVTTLAIDDAITRDLMLRQENKCIQNKPISV